MRKITEDAIRAFRNGTNFKRGNTRVIQYSCGTCVLLLHGNLIAKCRRGDISEPLEITNAGWNTTTTKERLNGFPTVNIVQKDFQWFLNGEAWDGGLIRVNW